MCCQKISFSQTEITRIEEQQQLIQLKIRKIKQQIRAVENQIEAIEEERLKLL